MRPHLSLDVRNVAASVDFYQRVFGVAPQKQTDDYAKFDLVAPSLNLSLVSSTGRVSAVDHLGIEVDSADEIATWRRRLEDQGILERVEENIACCFARQDKLWFTDPDGNAWEIFTVHEQLPVTGLLANTGCCVPKAPRSSEPATCQEGPGAARKQSERTLLGFVIGILFLLASSLSWAATDSALVGPPPTGGSVVYIAHDYGFTGPERVLEGPITLEVENQGGDLHHVQLIELLHGKTTADLQSAANVPPGRLPTWVRFVGGPNAVLPGNRAGATMRLRAGHYALICLIPDQHGVPHSVLGMIKPLAVIATEQAHLSLPTSDVIITQADFAFGLSRPILSGARTIEVLNAGNQRHEVVLVRLEPGATAKDFATALEYGGSVPPGKPIGGLVGIERGDRGFFTGHFDAGHYGVICFFVDQATGAPHFMKGMTLEFDVQ